MKKHAKKSLLIPILALVSVVAIAACCYLAQSFNAFAGEDELELESSVTEAPEVGATAAGAEDSETDFESDLNNVPNPTPTVKDVFTTIRLSTNEPFFGSVYENASFDTKVRDFYAWNGAEFGTFKVIDEKDIKISGFIVKELINGPTSWDFEHYTYIAISGSQELKTEVYVLRLSKLFYTFSGSTVSYTTLGDSAELTINVTPTYYIGFNANGGKFEDGSSVQWVAQGEYNSLKAPDYLDREGYDFAGWYTHPVWGERVDTSSQIPAWGELTMLYAHWVDHEKPITFSFNTSEYGQLFKYELNKYDLTTHNLVGDTETDITWTYTKAIEWKYEPEFGWTVNDNKISMVVYWEDDEFDYELYINPLNGQRINAITVNGAEVNLVTSVNYLGKKLLNSQYNNIVLSLGWAVPGFISVSSDTGQLVDCSIISQTRTSSIADVVEFKSDNVNIPLGSNAYAAYVYGGMNSLKIILGEDNSLYDKLRYSKLSILVIDYDKNVRDGRATIYTFNDNLVTLFDWFEINSYIRGLDVDGENIPMSNYLYQLESPFHTFTLKMTDQPADTTVTYDANGGHFADDSTSMIVDARFGEPLPVVETPKAIDNDFVGWFTEPEGGVQVDPEHFIWMPWQRETGVTLYAHWAYNPQPVPPEPVPPTPDPVNPDVPGGGGTAQTGDSMPLVPIAALAVIAALGCGLAIRKETSK